MAAETPALDVVGMRKRFGSLEVLKGISLTANDGDVISILGSSGSGKSTFLRCINLLETPDEGVVIVAGEVVKIRRRGDSRAEPADRRQVDRIRSELGMVFQSFNLWSHLTVLENLVEAPVHVQKRPRARMRRGGARVTRQGRHRRQVERLPRPSLGRPAAARRHRARARHAAEGDAVRRADLGARSRARGRGAARHARARRGGPHHARRHPRDGLRPRRLDAGDVPASGTGRGRGRAELALLRRDVGKFRQFISKERG